MTITCPKCGNSGQIDGDDSRFETRGRHEGCAVRKCVNCKSGLLIGLPSSELVGEPTVIPDRQWFDMEALWARQFSSTELPENERIELGLMFHSMFGFSHGYMRLFLETGASGVSSPEQSFYLNSLRTMCVNYFIGTSTRPSDVNVRHVLARHSLSELLQPIDALLDAPIGSSAFRSVLTRLRNKYLTHELFQLQPLQKLYDDFELSNAVNWERYNRIEDDLFMETEKLFYKLREPFPEAWMTVGDGDR